MTAAEKNIKIYEIYIACFVAQLNIVNDENIVIKNLKNICLSILFQIRIIAKTEKNIKTCLSIRKLLNLKHISGLEKEIITINL